MKNVELNSIKQFWENSLEKFKNVPDILSENTRLVLLDVGLPIFQMINPEEEVFFSPIQKGLEEAIIEYENDKYFIFGIHPYLEKNDYYASINLSSEKVFNLQLYSDEPPEFVNSSIIKFLEFLTKVKQFILFIEEKTKGNTEGEMYFLSNEYKTYKQSLIEIDEDAMIPGSYWYEVNLLIQYYYADYI